MYKKQCSYYKEFREHAHPWQYFWRSANVLEGSPNRWSREEQTSHLEIQGQRWFPKKRGLMALGCNQGQKVKTVQDDFTGYLSKKSGKREHFETCSWLLHNNFSFSHKLLQFLLQLYPLDVTPNFICTQYFYSVFFSSKCLLEKSNFVDLQ